MSKIDNNQQKKDNNQSNELKTFVCYPLTSKQVWLTELSANLPYAASTISL